MHMMGVHGKTVCTTMHMIGVHGMIMFLWFGEPNWEWDGTEMTGTHTSYVLCMF